MRGLHYNVNLKRSVGPVAVGTTGTGTTGKIVDRKGFKDVEFVFGYGTITATNATITVIVKEGDVTGTMTSIADGDLDGTEAAAGIAAGTPRTSDANKLVTKRLGYRGLKRYVQCIIKSTITATTPVFGGVLLSRPESAPVAT
jgi:hypothetical protein